MSSLVLESTALMVVLGALFCASLSLRTALRRRHRHAQLQGIALDHFRSAAQRLLRDITQNEAKGRLGWNGFRKFVIDRKVEETVDVTSFYLKPYDGKPIPRFRPGQHLTFRLRMPGQPRPVVRCYSLSEAPGGTDSYRITVKRLAAVGSHADTPDGVASCFLHDVAEEGHILDVRAPSGRFYLDDSTDRPLVLLAGGIGITPLLSMLNALCASESEREVWLFYGVRNRADHVMYDHLERVRRSHANVHVVVCYSAPTPCCVPHKDYHHSGRISIGPIRRMVRSTDCQFYLCGPAAMQESLIQDLRAWGVAETDIKYESFGTRIQERAEAEVDTLWDTVAVNGLNSNGLNSKVMPLRPRGAGAGASVGGGAGAGVGAGPAPQTGSMLSGAMVEVGFARSNKVAHWRPGGPSLLNLAESLGVPIEGGCRTGQCGSCATAIKQGGVTYATPPGHVPERGACLPCMAIPKDGLVLDA